MKAKTKRREALRNILFVYRLIWETDKTLMAIIAVEAICNVAMPFIGIYLPKLALSLLEQGVDAQTLITRLGLFILLMAAIHFFGRYASDSKYFRINQLRPLLMKRIFYKTLDCDYSYLESPAGQDHYQRAQQMLLYGDSSATSRLVPAMTGLVTGLFGFFLYAGVLLALHPLVVVLLILSSIVSYIAMQRAIRYQQGRKSELASLEKKLQYIELKTDDVQAGKEVRMYGLSHLFSGLTARLCASMVKIHEQSQGKWYHVTITDALLVLARDGLAYAYLIWMISGGQLPVSDFVFFFGAITGFSTWLSGILKQGGEVARSQQDVGDMRSYLEENHRTEPDPAADAPDPHHPPAIVFEDVSFSYGGADTPVLKDFNLTIGPGEKLALVGINGAGKTTLVKLLCGFYQPDAGRILINGVDSSHFRREDLFALFSAVFQDVMILPFTLAENVALQPGPQLDRERVRHCLRQADLLADAEALPQGLDTPMHRSAEDAGLTLSGGQQQKLLIARALYKDAPMLILDEPTAALDPIAESALYESYHALASNKTALYISHRLASTRFCDRVLFVQDGTVKEAGTHEALMRQGGAYAHMFDVQSHYYQTQKEEAV